MLSIRCQLVRPQAPTESPLMSSSIQARNCYDTCLICSPRYGLKRVCHRTSRTHLSCSSTSVKEIELSVTITEAYLCFQSLASPCTHPAKQTRGPRGQLRHYTGKPVWLPSRQRCHVHSVIKLGGVIVTCPLPPLPYPFFFPFRVGHPYTPLNPAL